MLADLLISGIELNQWRLHFFLWAERLYQRRFLHFAPHLGIAFVHYKLFSKDSNPADVQEVPIAVWYYLYPLNERGHYRKG